MYHSKPIIIKFSVVKLFIIINLQVYYSKTIYQEKATGLLN